jgi:hypothetical protein
VGQDSIEILQIKAFEQDECLTGMLGDQKFMEEQQLMLKQIESQNSEKQSNT